MALTHEDILELFRETDHKFQETDRKFQETGRLLKEESRQTADRIAAVSKAIGELGGRLGDFVESAVRPAALRLFRERGIAMHEVHQNVSSQRGDEGIEVDLLVVNDTDVVGIECKSRLSIEDIDEHLERLEKLKRLLPSYAGKRLLGAVAAMVIPDDVAKYAYRRGLFVIAQTGEHLTIRNDTRFQPRSW